jgi:hypothetical protein
MTRIVFLTALVLTVVTSEGAYARGSSHTSHSSSTYSSSSRSDHTVRGYTRSNGTYVHSYKATNADATRNNNYTTKGNVNPYTGKVGTKARDGE